MEKQIERVRRTRDGNERMWIKKKSEQKKKREYEKLDEELKQTFQVSDALSNY